MALRQDFVETVAQQHDTRRFHFLDETGLRLDACRRYGRAVVEAACAAIGRAGRPLHAAEILEVLVGQGFTLPGRDPVAALNTRLWKRSGPGGPLSRVGEATYALAPPDPEPARGGPVTQT